MRFLLLILLFLFLSKDCYASNLLNNADFENNDLEFWSSSGGGATATYSSVLKHNGSYALKVSHSKKSSYGFQQVIGDLEGGMFYKLNGFAASDNVNTINYFLRVAWYQSNDGSGSQLSSPFDSKKESNTDGQWFEFSEVIQAPNQANSCKVRLVLNSKENGVLASAFFDDLIFEESIAPTPTLTNTPTPTPTLKKPTSTPTPTKVSTPTLTLTSTPTPKSVRLIATFSGEILGQGNSGKEDFYLLQKDQSAPEEFEDSFSFSFNFLAKLILLTGMILLLSGGLWLWYNLRH